MAIDAPQGVVVEYQFRDVDEDEFWLDVIVNGSLYDVVGPFASDDERKRAYADLTSTLKSQGAIDLPLNASID